MGGSVCVDLLCKFANASNYRIEGWRLAVKHSVCNHLLVVASKSLEKRRLRNQTEASRQAGFVVGIGRAKEDVLVLYDIFQKFAIGHGGLPNLVIAEDSEVMPMARLAISIEF